MWEHYKKTFLGMQIVMWLVAGLVLVWTHLWIVSSVFLITMQIGAVLGAMWAVRLKRMFGGVRGQGGRRPLRRA